MKAVFENKELKIIGFETTAMKVYEPMFHPHGELLCVLDGKVSVTIDGSRTDLLKNDMCIVFPYAVHSYEPSEDARVIIILFSPDSAGEFYDILLGKSPQNPYFEISYELMPLIEKILMYSKDNAPLIQRTCGAYLKVLIGEILLKMSLSDINPSDSHTVRKVMNWCGEHFTEDIAVKDVCANVFVSERYVTRIFAEKVGCSFRDYINTLRIQRAVSLIENSNMKITEIMYECGFKNQSTFNRVFLAETGSTPREYKKREV